MKIRNRIKELRTVKASDLTPNPKNWRTHPKGQQDALKGILAEVGYADALLARETSDGSLMLVDGHLRAETTPSEQVPVLILDIDEAEADKLLLSLDPLAALAETNAQALDSLLREIDTGSEGLQEMYADMADAADLYKDEQTDVTEDDVPEPPADPITKKGDVWVMGNHRLVCGDCTDETTMQKLLGDDQVTLVFTDPPYGIDYEYNTHKDTSGDEYIEFCKNFYAVIKDIAPVQVISTGWKYKNFWYQQQPYDELVWFDKTKQSGGRAFHLRKCEPIFVFGKPHEKYKWDIFEVSSQRGDGMRELHTCPKPMQLIADIIQPQTKPGDIVCDVFLGSGTTLAVCEQLNRACRGTEIDPAYCDVIVTRWETMTGKKAERQSDG